MKTKIVIFLLLFLVKVTAQDKTDVQVKLDKINEILDTKDPKIQRYNVFTVDTEKLYIWDYNKINTENAFTHSIPVSKIDLSKLKVKKVNDALKIMIVSNGPPAMKLYTFTSLKKEYGVFIDTKENGETVINLIKEIAEIFSQNNQLMVSKKITE